MQKQTEEALIRVLNAFADRLQVGGTAPDQLEPGFYDNELELWVDHTQAIKSLAKEQRRLQEEVVDWRSKRQQWQEEHRSSMAVLLENYRALAKDVDWLKSGPVLAPDRQEGELFGSLRARIERLEHHAQDADGMLASDGAGSYRALQMEIRGLSERLASLERSATSPAPNTAIRDAMAHSTAQIEFLKAQVNELGERLAQSEQRRSGWQRGIDAALGRRPR